VWRILKRLGLNRLPASQRYTRHDRRWKRYEKPLPGHRVQIDVKFIQVPLTSVAPSPSPPSPRCCSTASRLTAVAPPATCSTSASKYDPRPSNWCHAQQRRNSISGVQKGRFGIACPGALRLPAGGAGDEVSVAWNVVDHGRSAGGGGRLSYGWAGGSGRRHPGQQRAGSRWGQPGQPAGSGDDAG
jgi:hypothetical protein